MQDNERIYEELRNQVNEVFEKFKGKLELENTTTKKKAFGQHKNVRLTEKEYNNLVKNIGIRETAYWIETLSERFAIKNYGYKSHYRALLSWRKNNITRPIVRQNSLSADLETQTYDELITKIAKS